MSRALLLPHCPLCTAPDAAKQFDQGERTFLECSHCDLLFTDPISLLSQDQERRRYDNHENGVDCVGYRAHLKRVSDRLIPKLSAGAVGLDFGCGPVPALARLFAESGFTMDTYDPFYAPALGPVSHRYDFITCTEAAEHFGNPRQEFLLMQQLLKPGGRIGIMTNLREGDRRSSAWWYLRDPTHRCFYSRKTFQWLATFLRWNVVSDTDDVIVMQDIEPKPEITC